TEFTGIGNGNLLAMFGFNYGGWEYGRVLVHPTGTVEVHTGSADQGQGHATSYVQIVCDVLEIPARQCSVVEGDTGQVEFGLGTFNSRSMAVGGAALHEAARRLLAKAKRMAAHALGVTADDIVYAKGIFSVRREMSPFAQGSR
ncbi:molybdopterin-dependent oxidoreductase, partial [Escherichia coli]|nr:molybdopterin-dependent oxidoreductase [Escherichia coli]